jgi:membrane protein implicated in regulation of membrane protease activity
MVHLSKNAQYGIAGALAVYIVFFTRPAPAAVVNMLSNPLAQLAVLGAIVYVGATISLLVALVAAVAVVLSIPGREFMKNKDDDKKSKKEGMDTKDSLKSVLDMPVVGKALDAVDKKVEDKRSKGEPTPAADMIESKTDSTKGSEGFTSGGAPF